MKTLKIVIMREPGNEDLPLPAYQTSGASGMDLIAAVDAPLTIHPGSIAQVSTGIRVSIPEGYEGQVRPRSGLALRHGIGILNSPGTIDSDYRGVVSIVLYNIGKVPFVVERGARIAQLVFCKVERAVLTLSVALDGTERQSGGFGSTG